MFKLLLAFSLATSSLSTTGWDGIQSCNSGCFQCLQQNGLEFFVARVWESIGDYDETGIANIKAARAAGWQYVDGYIFPCLKSSCAPPENQIEATVNRLTAEGAQYGMLWLDLEIFAWSNDQNYNRDFITRLGNQLNAMNVNWGIYTNNNNWASIVGIGWSQWSSKPLWWANYNGHQDYSGFVPFGGWTQPSIHQYAGSVNGPCGINMDMNWY